MLSAPSPYPTVSSSIPAPDDAQIVPSHRLPSICVDYLSHNWARDEDVWNSWKAMTKSKNEIANGVRLENASWRTWMKQMRKLKTVSPETLNWLKDSDVTWLYGPLHQGQVEAVPPPKIASAAERLDLVENSPRPGGLKSNANSTSAQSLPRSKLSDLRPSNGKNSPSANNSPSETALAGGNTAVTSSRTPNASSAASFHDPDGTPAPPAATVSSAFINNNKKVPQAYRTNSDGTTSPPATKSILKHRTIQDLLSNPQANSAAGLGSFRSASQPSLPELEAAAAATGLALREGQGDAVLTPAQTRALGLGLNTHESGSEESSLNGLATSPPPLSSPIGAGLDGLVSPNSGSSSLSLASDGEAAASASSLKSPTTSAASLVSLSSTGSGAGTPTGGTARKLSGAPSSFHLGHLQGHQQQAVRERRHISFNSRVEQCIALDMDQVQEYAPAASDDEHGHGGGAGGYGARQGGAGRYGGGGRGEYGFDDHDEEDGAMWRSGPGQRGHRYYSGHDDEDDEEEMLTINVRSSSASHHHSTGRPGSSSGGSSTSATSYSNRSRSSLGGGGGSKGTKGGHHSSDSSSSRSPHYQLPFHHQPRTIAKLAPTMLRGGSAQPETGDWLEHHQHQDDDSDAANDVDLHIGTSPHGGGANAHVPAYVHNPIVHVDHRYQHGTILGEGEYDEEYDDEDGGGAQRRGGDMDGDGFGESEDENGDGRGRAHDSSRSYANAAASTSSSYAGGSGGASGRVHQSGRGSGRDSKSQHQSADSSEEGSSDWDRRTSLDLASPTFPASPAGEEEDDDDGVEEQAWEKEERVRSGRGVPADDVELRTGNKARSGGGGGAQSSSGRGSGGGKGSSGARSRSSGAGSGNASASSSGFWADGDDRSRKTPASPASSASSYTSSGGRGGGGARTRPGGDRRRQSSNEVAVEDKAVHGVLNIDVDNVPSNDPNSPVNPAHGPTPLNTPTFLLGKPGKGASASASPSKSRRNRRSGGGGEGSGSYASAAAGGAEGSAPAFDDEDDEADYDPAMAVLPHRRTSTGALVAPKNRQVQVPLAHDYVDEGDEGGLINRAVEMINTARDLFGALWGASDSDRGRSWRDSTYE
ncbi:hypothetical protein V8E36_003918 [Tilletia maclaganii]